MLDVACAVQGAYVPHSAAMLRSVFAAGGVGGVRAHYLHGPGLRRASRRRLERLAQAAGGEIVFWPVPDDRVAGLPVHGYFTSAMWYRILLPELLPDVERVLYLDVDTLALDDLAPLWDIDLDGALVAAVTNVFERGRWDAHTEALGVAQEDYFNSGVLLLHLAEMRRSGSVDEMRRLAARHGDRLLWPDQDVLNLALGPRRVALHPRWNAMNSLFVFDNADEAFGPGEAQEARARPAIRHFEGPGANKPWARGATVPHAAEYRRNRNATPWRHRWVRA